MNRKVSYITLLMLLAVTQLQAQVSYTNKAILFYQENQFDKAKIYIDSAIASTKEGNDAYTWYVKGMIYKDDFKANEFNNTESPARIISVEAFKKCMELDAANEHKANAATNIKFLAGTYYNEMVKNLDTVNYEKAEPLYIKYKETMKLVTPTMDFTKSDKEVYLFLGAQISRKFNFKKEGVTQKYFDMAVNVFNRVIAIDSNDCNAHYQIAQLYYNYGVETILSLDDTTPLEKVIEAQDKCVVLFQKSLPHMKKAYQLSNCKSKKELMRALMGIYYQLNEMEKYNTLQDELKKLPPKEDKD